jgi:hypothetical protein
VAVTITYTPYSPPNQNTNGVINSGDCQVSQSSGMQIQVSTGSAWILGTFSHTGDPQLLTVANNTSGSIRYDLVVIHVDLIAATADYRILTGNLNPTQNNSVWELPLAGIGVPNNAVSISNANIQDLRVISNDYTAKNLCTLTKSTDTTIASGAELTLAWDAPSQANDPYRYYIFNNYIQTRVAAFYNVQSQIRWTPASTNSKPVVFKVNMVDPTDFRTTEIYAVSSVQTAAGNVDFTFNQVLQIPQSYYVYLSVKNTTDVSVTVKSTASVSPFLRLQFTTYPIRAF